MKRIGALVHRVTLENPATPVPDGDGAFTQTWSALDPPEMSVAIMPATAHELERIVANTVLSTATHIITMRYHNGVTTKTRLTKGPRNTDGTLMAGSREFHVTGLQNPGEQNDSLLLACAEVIV